MTILHFTFWINELEFALNFRLLGMKLLMMILCKWASVHGLCSVTLLVLWFLYLLHDIWGDRWFNSNLHL